MTNTSDRIKLECPVCGRHTYVSTRTGDVYTHNVPEQIPVRVCAQSRVQVVLPDGELHRSGPLVAPPHPARIMSADSERVPHPDGPSQSVRTLRGGLPTLGRHR